MMSQPPSSSSLLTGQIAKLVLIQLQFVKKELLEAMQVGVQDIPF